MLIRRPNAALAAIVAEGFFSRLSFGLLTFTLPLYAYQRFGIGVAEIGLLLSLNLAVAIVLKPLMGALADRIGMKPSFTAAIGLRSVVTVLLAVAAAPWHLFAVRGLHGVSIALRDPAANVLIAEHGGEKAVASAFAWYQTAKTVAGSLGKFAAGVVLTVTAFNYTAVFLLAFVLSAVPVLVVARYVHGGDAAERRETERAAAEGAPPARARVAPFVCFGFLVSGTAYMLASLFPLFAVEYAGLSPAQAGSLYLVGTLVALSGPAFGWVSDHVSRKLVLSVRSVANVLSSAVYLALPSYAGLLVGRVADDAGKAAFRPAWGALMAHVARFDRRRRARSIAAMSAGEDAGEVAGPVVAGLIWSAWGIPALLVARMLAALVTEAYAVVVLRRFLPSEASAWEAAASRRVAALLRRGRGPARPAAGPPGKAPSP